MLYTFRADIYFLWAEDTQNKKMGNLDYFEILKITEILFS